MGTNVPLDQHSVMGVDAPKQETKERFKDSLYVTYDAAEASLGKALYLQAAIANANDCEEKFGFTKEQIQRLAAARQYLRKRGDANDGKFSRQATGPEIPVEMRDLPCSFVYIADKWHMLVPDSTIFRSNPRDATKYPERTKRNKDTLHDDETVRRVKFSIDVIDNAIYSPKIVERTSNNNEQVSSTALGIGHEMDPQHAPNTTATTRATKHGTKKEITATRWGGHSLAAILHEMRQGIALYTEQELEEIAKQCLQRLQEWHEKDYVHRDIKPDNIVVSRDDDGLIIVKFIDTDFAREKYVEAKDTQPFYRSEKNTGPAGTNGYMPYDTKTISANGYRYGFATDAFSVAKTIQAIFKASAGCRAHQKQLLASCKWLIKTKQDWDKASKNIETKKNLLKDAFSPFDERLKNASESSERALRLQKIISAKNYEALKNLKTKIDDNATVTEADLDLYFEELQNITTAIKEKINPYYTKEASPLTEKFQFISQNIINVVEKKPEDSDDFAQAQCTEMLKACKTETEEDRLASIKTNIQAIIETYNSDLNHADKTDNAVVKDLEKAIKADNLTLNAIKKALSECLRKSRSSNHGLLSYFADYIAKPENSVFAARFAPSNVLALNKNLPNFYQFNHDTERKGVDSQLESNFKDFKSLIDNFDDFGINSNDNSNSLPGNTAVVDRFFWHSNSAKEGRNLLKIALIDLNTPAKNIAEERTLQALKDTLYTIILEYKDNVRDLQKKDWLFSWHGDTGLKRAQKLAEDIAAAPDLDMIKQALKECFSSYSSSTLLWKSGCREDSLAAFFVRSESFMKHAPQDLGLDIPEKPTEPIVTAEPDKATTSCSLWRSKKASDFISNVETMKNSFQKL